MRGSAHVFVFMQFIINGPELIKPEGRRTRYLCAYHVGYESYELCATWPFYNYNCCAHTAEPCGVPFTFVY